MFIFQGNQWLPARIDVDLRGEDRVGITYHESASWSALKAYNALNSPGAAAISFYAQTSPLSCNLYPWSVHCEYALMRN